jgi:putative copper export protein
MFMKTILLALHLIFIGVWLGCIVTEALFERALLGKGTTQKAILGALHKKVDIFVEIPAFMLVLITGIMMISAAPESPLFLTKIGFGMLAILANIYCVWIVFKRSKHASEADWDAFKRVDHILHKVGAIIPIGILIALGIGLYLYAGV